MEKRRTHGNKAAVIIKAVNKAKRRKTKKATGLSKRRRFLIVVLAAGLVFLAVRLALDLLGGANGKLGFGNARTDTFDCASSSAPRDCYEQKYKSITEQSGAKEAFRQLRADYDTSDSVRADCHQIVHVIGRTAANLYGSVSQAYAEGDEFCWSGYYHGVMEAILAEIPAGEVAKNIDGICEQIRGDNQYSFYHYNCVHGLGHGAMLVEGHDLIAALSLCDNLKDSWERTSCWGGAFMENVVTGSNHFHSTKYLRDGEPLYPCTAVAEKYKTECYKMQTSRALDVLGGDFGKVFELCATVGPYRATCYQSLGRDASGRSVSNVQQTRATCLMGQDNEARSNCVVGAVKDFISYHHNDEQAKELCEAFDTAKLTSLCLDTAANYYASFN